MHFCSPKDFGRVHGTSFILQLAWSTQEKSTVNWIHHYVGY